MAAPVASDASSPLAVKTEPEGDGGLAAAAAAAQRREPAVTLLGPVCGPRPLAWSRDHRLAVCTGASLAVMELVCDVLSARQELALHRTSVPVHKDAHVTRVGPAEEVAEAKEALALHPDPTVRQPFLADRVMNPSVGVHKGVKHASWSPLGCDSSGRCLLACLTLDHRLTVHHSNKRLEWKPLVDLSKKYGQRLRERGYAGKDENPPGDGRLDSDELKRRFRMQTPLTMEWSGIYGVKRVRPDNTCTDVDVVLLAILMENGDLVLWKFALPFTDGSDVAFYDVIESGVSRPSDLAWWEYDGGGRRMSGLIVGSEEGPLKIMPVGLSGVKGYFTLRHPVILWKESDELAVENLKCVSLSHPVHKSSCSLIVASRGCYVFWCLLTITPSGLNVHNSHVAGLHSLPVVSLAVSRHDATVYSCSTDGWVKKLTPAFTEKTLTFRQEDLSRPDDLAGRRIHGIAVSSNGAYMALASTQGMVDGYHPVHRTYQVHFVALKTPETASALLLRSPTRNLYETADLLDLVRWSVLKQKCVPGPLLLELDQKIQEEDLPYFWRFKLFLLRVLYQALAAPPADQRSRTAREDGKASTPGGGEEEDAEGEGDSREEERPRERLAEVQERISSVETRLMRENMKKVLGVVYLNTWITQNTSIPTCGLVEYLASDASDRAAEVLIGHIKKKMNKQMFVERCSLCQETLPFVDHRRATCQNGHMWLRCVLSYQACQTLRFRRCLLLDSVARLPEPEDPEWIKKILRTSCSLCDSPMI